MNRNQIEAKILKNENKIKALKAEVLDLHRQAVLLCDKKQWFTEKLETFTIRENRKKVQVEKLIGRVHWIENFKDDDDPNGKGVDIERSEVVRMDGNWNW